MQSDVCLCLALLAESSALPPPDKERLLRQEGGANLVQAFVRSHAAAVHVEGGADMRAGEVAAICRSSLPEVVDFGRWCLARLAFNYPADFIGTGCWETLHELARTELDEQLQVRERRKGPYYMPTIQTLIQLSI